jgi:predicted metalloprotease
MLGGFGGGGMRLGLGGFAVLLVLSFVFKRDLISPFLGLGGGGGSTSAPVAAGRDNPSRKQAEQPMVQFVSFVLDDIQKTWAEQILPDRYRRTKLVLFWDQTVSACGGADAASGPFYCPGDRLVYIDLGFYRELKERFGAPGEFAQAYVIAHEVGHHVQNLLGIERRMRALQQENPGARNQLSVRLELQADCFAGLWGHSTAERSIIDQGDIAAGLNAAAAIGDDRIQRMSGRAVSPERFTHGSSAQRQEWFKRGLDTGDIRACDTFNTGR